MKHLSYFLAIILVVLSACGGGSSSSADGNQGPFVNLSVKGSDTVLPLSQNEAENFMGTNPQASITVVGGGSGVGISALISGSTDIAMVSRELSFDEQNSLALLGEDYEKVVIAYDALAVVVNPENPVKNLTIKELELIFTGKITNWQELGGPNVPVVAYSRETSSGTYEYFKKRAMHDREYAPSVLKSSSTGAVVKSVSQNTGAIGYIGVAYLDETVTAVSIFNKDSEHYINPSVKNAQNNTYPIVRPLYYLFLQENTKKVKPYIDYILSDAGQQVVNKVGYVPLRANLFAGASQVQEEN